MSLDKSLKSKNTLERHRNVLTRPERIAKLKELGRWTQESSPLGLPKITHRKAAVGKKDKVIKKEGDGTAVETAAPEAESTP